MAVRAPLAAIAASIFFLFATPARAVEIVPGPIRAEVLRIVDGDTIDVRARIWPGMVAETRVRIAGLDTPENKARCPAEAEAAARATVALSILLAGGQARLYDVRLGKFAGRVLARVETLDGRDTGRALIAAGLGRPYAGGKRAGWCEAAVAVP